jgi:hypothetical protein
LPRGGYLLNDGAYLAFVALPSPAGIARLRASARFPLAAGPGFELTRHPSGQWSDPHLPQPYANYFQLRAKQPRKVTTMLGSKYLRKMLDDLDQPRLASDGDVITLEYQDIPSYSERRLRLALEIVAHVSNHDLFGTQAMTSLAGAEPVLTRLSWEQRPAPSVRVRGRTDVELGIASWRRRRVTRVRAAASEAPAISLRLTTAPDLLLPPDLPVNAHALVRRLHSGRLLSRPRQVVFDFPEIETHESRLRDAVELVRLLASPAQASAYRD